MKGADKSPFVLYLAGSHLRSMIALKMRRNGVRTMKIYLTSMFVDEQEKAEAFYTDILGFKVKNDIPLSDNRWLTVVSHEDPEGTELLLEPSDHPAVKPFRDALLADGIPAHSFQVQDIDADWQRLAELGVEFTVAPTNAGPVRMAVFNDTCGNLIQLIEMTKPETA